MLRRLAPLVAVLLAAVLVSACVPRPPGNLYDGPSPLRWRLPGAVVWAEPLTVPAGSNAGAWRVMYHSRDSQNRDVAVTGTIYYPKEKPPPGGWPVVSFGHGTTGMGPSCAPSRNGAARNSFGVKGVVVATDYIGLGPNGKRHAYLSGKAEGHSIIDLVRAARRIPGVNAGRHWVTVGVSQGGHASLFAGELARTYAPELKLDGVVAAAPGSGLTDTYPEDNPLIVDVISVMALYGIAVDHPQIRPDDYVSPLLAEKSSVLDTGCLTESTVAIASIPSGQLFKANPRTTEPARSAAIANDPGHFPSSAPVLLVQGSADSVVVPPRTEKLLTTMCQHDQAVERILVPGATHDNALSLAASQVSAWLNARIAGAPAGTSCAAP